VNGRQLHAGGEEAAARCRLPVRAPGQGDHEIWYSPVSNRRLMVDAKIKSRHWANHTLKQAGLPKAF